MPHAKKILAILISSTAFSACISDVDATPDETVTPIPEQSINEQVFPDTGYTKIGNDGIILADQSQEWSDEGSEAEGTQWSCVRDNDTGLYWEVKTNDGGLRDRGWTYTWYDSNPATSGGIIGWDDGTNACYDTARCDTEKYIEDVNATQLCGFDDWRLPKADRSQDDVDSAQELQSLLNCQSNCDIANAPYIDTSYFPNTRFRDYFSSSPDASDRAFVRAVKFRYGTRVQDVGEPSLVRLVRASESL